MLSLRGDGFTRADIIDLRSSIRKCGGSRVNGMPVISPYSVFSSLEYDGLVKPGGRFKLSYTAGGLMLNGHPIPDELAAKYRFFLSDLALSAGYRDFQPRTDTDIVTVER